MATLVENILSLEKEADELVAKARGEAKEIERSAGAEIEAYRRKLAEETDRRVSTFHREMEEKHQRSVAETDSELAQGLEAIDQIPDERINRQMHRVVALFSER